MGANLGSVLMKLRAPSLGDLRRYLSANLRQLTRGQGGFIPGPLLPCCSTTRRLYSHALPKVKHWPQQGFLSSHFLLRFRHSSHPCRDRVPGIGIGG